MITSKTKRIRRDYAPLTVACIVRCLTPASPIGQVYNDTLAQFEPNRSLSPTTIFPDVRAGAKDGSWKQEQVNDLLTSMVWRVDGVDITTLSEWSGLYEITTEGENKGAITIKRNVETTKRYALTFSAQFADTRLGINMSVRSEPIILSTTVKGGDEYQLEIDGENDMKYDVTRDMLELREYQIAHGITPDYTEAEAIATRESYVREFAITAKRGTTAITSGYTLKLFQIASDGTETQRTAADGTEITSFSASAIKFDLRMVKKADYVLRMYVDDRMVAKLQMSVDRLYPSVYCSPSNGTSILEGDTVRYDKAMVNVEGRVLTNPAYCVAIQWKVKSYSIDEVAFNEGETTCFELSKTGIGDTEETNWLDVYVEYGLKEEYSVATDESGNTLVDEDGNVLIMR